MPIETIITAAILTVTGYMYNHGMSQRKESSWVERFLMPWRANKEATETKKASLMVYVNENYDAIHHLQDKKPDLHLIEK
jgi:hypothetical protein